MGGQSVVIDVPDHWTGQATLPATDEAPVPLILVNRRLEGGPRPQAKMSADASPGVRRIVAAGALLH